MKFNETILVIFKRTVRYREQMLAKLLIRLTQYSGSIAESTRPLLGSALPVLLLSLLASRS